MENPGEQDEEDPYGHEHDVEAEVHVRNGQDDIAQIDRQVDLLEVVGSAGQKQCESYEKDDETDHGETASIKTTGKSLPETTGRSTQHHERPRKQQTADERGHGPGYQQYRNYQTHGKEN